MSQDDVDQKQNIDQVIPNQSTIKLTTTYKDNDAKEQTNESYIPQVGLGTWKSPPDKVVNAVEYAIKVGYKHIDCAHCYGNEVEVGKALTKSFTNGLIKRKDIFITSKLWNTDHHPDDIPIALNQTLTNLNLDYLDLYLIHWPYNFKRTRNQYNINLQNLKLKKKDLTQTEYQNELNKIEKQLRFPKNNDGTVQYGDVVSIIDTWKGLEKLVISGKVKHIGLSNFNIDQIAELLAVCDIKPSMVQCECHPYLNQNELIKYCHNNNIEFTCYSPLGSPSRPNQNHYYPILLNDNNLNEISLKFNNKTNAHIAIRFQIDRNNIVIPKSVTPSRIKANLNVFDFKIDNNDMNKILNINKDLRYCAPTTKLNDGTVVYRDRNHTNFPFKNETVKTENDFK